MSEGFESVGRVDTVHGDGTRGFIDVGRNERGSVRLVSNRDGVEFDLRLPAARAARVLELLRRAVEPEPLQ